LGIALGSIKEFGEEVRDPEGILDLLEVRVLRV